MKDDLPPYAPISCEFHDVLEGIAATRRISEIVWIDPGNSRCARTGKVTDVYAHAGAEYLAMDSGEIIRLDHILQADGIKKDRS